MRWHTIQRQLNVSEEHNVSLLRVEEYAMQETSRSRQQDELTLPPPVSAAPLLTLLFNLKKEVICSP
jgi:hypothetical protein